MRPFTFSKTGRYWDNNTEIDVTVINPDGKNLILGECKYWKEPVGINILPALEEKSRKVAWNNTDRKTWFILFNTGGFTPELQALATNANKINIVIYHK